MAAESLDGESIPFPWFCFCVRPITHQIVFFYPEQLSAGLRNVSTTDTCKRKQKQQTQKLRNFNKKFNVLYIPIKKHVLAFKDKTPLHSISFHQ